MPTGSLRGTFTIPAADARPASIATGSDGNIWFTENGNTVPPTSVKIGRLNASSGAIVEFSLSGPPSRIVASADGSIRVECADGSYGGYLLTRYSSSSVATATCRAARVTRRSFSVTPLT